MSPGRAGRPALLLAAAAIMIARAPVYVTAPNFWAEEGSYYFAAAWNTPWWEALRFRPPAYFLVYANLAALLAATLVTAGLLPLERAPQVTALAAFAVQLLPVALIAWGRSPLWRTPGHRIAGVAVVMFGAITSENWFNTIQTQAYFVVSTALLLTEPPVDRGPRRWVVPAVLALAGFSAPVAAALAPLFAWRALATRTRGAVVEAGVVALAAAAQATAVFIDVRGPIGVSAGSLSLRPFALPWDLVAQVWWLRAIVLPVAGADAAVAFTTWMRGHGWFAPNQFPLVALGAVGAGLLGLGVGLPRGTRVVLPAALVIVALTTFAFVARGLRIMLFAFQTSPRYFYAPGVLLLLLLVGNVRWDRSWAGRVVALACAVAIASGVWAGIVRYGDWLAAPDWPVWADEVAVWRKDPAYRPRIWPPGWSLVLLPEPGS